MSQQINLVINGKGGVGKSFVATNLVQYFKDRQLVHLAIDTDHENSTLKRFHPEAQFINLEEEREIDGVLDAAESRDLLVVDCRAASTDLFVAFFEEVGLEEVLAKLDARLTVICPVNHEADSVEQIRVLSSTWEHACQWIIVKNEAHCESFKLYDSSKVRRHLLDSLQAREISMKRLHNWLVTAFNEHGVTATGALKHPAFNLLDRQRVKRWQTALYEQFDLVSELLLPAASQPSGKVAGKPQ
jgi:hypothetical protein